MQEATTTSGCPVGYLQELKLIDPGETTDYYDRAYKHGR